MRADAPGLYADTENQADVQLLALSSYIAALQGQVAARRIISGWPRLKWTPLSGSPPLLVQQGPGGAPQPVAGMLASGVSGRIEGPPRPSDIQRSLSVRAVSNRGSSSRSTIKSGGEPVSWVHYRHRSWLHVSGAVGRGGNVVFGAMQA